MPRMLFQEGNTFGAKARLFEATLKRAIAQDSANRLRNAAEKLLDKAADGEPWAIQFLAAKLDGLPRQAVEIKRIGDVSDMSLEELQSHVQRLLAGEAVDIESRPVEPSRIAA